jgi:xanthine dehydrogenase accessory factor
LCGGQLSLLVEPLTSPEQIQPAVVALEQRQLIQRQINLTSGEVKWATGTSEIEGKLL